MTQSQILAFVRQFITFVSAYAIGAGYMTQEQAGALGELAIAAVPVASLAWSLWASRKAGIVTAASKLSNVEAIQVTTSSFADKIPGEKVTASTG